MGLISRLLGQSVRATTRPTGEVDAESMHALVEGGRAQEAMRVLRNALERDPRNADAWHLLGLVQHRSGNPQEAARMIERALALRPDVAFYRDNLWVALAAESAALVAAGRQPEAVSRLNAQENLPAGLAVRRFLLQSELCDWSQDRTGLRHLIERWVAAPGDPEFAGIHPFVAWHIDVPESWRLAVTQAYADRIIAMPERAEIPEPARPSGGGSRRIRIGYLSADFHNHPTMHLMRGMFGTHDRRRFEVFAYSLGPDDGSQFRRRVTGDLEHFTDLTGCSEGDAAQRIRADAIDVLVDLKGFTLGAMPGVLALRPAPVSITWLGYPATIGRGLADYAIVDRVIVPDPAGAAFGEKLIRMPHCYQVTDDDQPIAGEAPTRGECGLPESALVFACFNNSYKIEPEVFGAWMRLLAKAPASVLWLFRSNPWCEANLKREARSCGIDPDRLVFAGAIEKSAHLSRLRLADLVLDTRLINAHTGASDALWAGVPLVTCCAEGFPSRVAASVLAAAGLPQLVCTDLEEYEARALDLALDFGRRTALREYLAAERARIPLFDTARFVRNLEFAIESVWQRHCDGEPAAHFDVGEAC